MRSPKLSPRNFARLLLVIALALFSLVGGTVTLYGVQSGTQVGVGSSWVYSVRLPSGIAYKETQSVTGLELCGFSICSVYMSQSSFTKSVQWITREWMLMRSEIVDEGGNTRAVHYDNGLLLYRVPLSPGDSWTWDTEATRITRVKVLNAGIVTREDRVTIEGDTRKVTGLETIAVPAGTFSAYIVDHRDQNGILSQRIWYSEEAKDAVRYLSGFGSVFSNNRELETYQLAPPSIADLLQLKILAIPLPYLLLVGLALLIGSGVLYRALRFKVSGAVV